MIIPKDEKKSFYWYRQAALQGSADAMLETANRYDNGVGVKMNKRKALEWYLKRTETYATADSKKLSDALYAAAAENHRINNVEQEVALYELAANCGHAKAMHKMGQAYEKGVGVEQNNVEQAVALYELAANCGHAKAMYQMGQAYEKGVGVEQNIETALDWYCKSKEKGYAISQKAIERITHGFLEQWELQAQKDNDVKWLRWFGDLYLYGYYGGGIPPDLEDAVLFYGEAIDVNDPYATVSLGQLYAKMQGVEQKLDKAEKLYNDALRMFRGGSPEKASVEYHLGELYEIRAQAEADPIKSKKHMDSAYNNYYSAAAGGDPLANVRLGKMYAEGFESLKIEQDLDEARKYYESAYESLSKQRDELQQQIRKTENLLEKNSLQARCPTEKQIKECHNHVLRLQEKLKRLDEEK